MTENAVAREVVDTAYRIHTTLGPSLLESVYVTVLANQLQKRELRVTRQQPIPVVFEETYFDMGFRADLMVEGNVIIEVKSIADVMPLWRVRRCQQCGYAMDSRPHHPGRWLVWLPCDNRAICRADRRNCS